ncbi:MAG: HAMP domain-containing sensor histidine kinase, partial [Patescibacteria group bacterium]
YTHEDIRLLESLSNQAAISIENARLYNEVEGFNQTLKRKVDDATKRLRELLKIKSDFLTVASHQLRTPTSIVRGMLSLVIEEKDLSSEEREKFISQAYEGINRLERIIHELLNATELEGKKMKLDFKKTRVEDTIEEIVSNLSPLAEQLKVKLAFNKPIRSISKTLADPIKLKEAITNIIDNAIHYSAEGEVEISVRRKQDQIIIEVKDTGIGMSKNDQRMLFTKFSRGEGILQIHPNGTGLGLFIAKKMLEAMGGTITAESKGKGKGSKFTLTIPIK